MYSTWAPIKPILRKIQKGREGRARRRCRKLAKGEASATFKSAREGGNKATMDVLLSAALQEVAVEGIQGELQKNFENRLIDLQ
jgi:hypothetical protein